MKNDRTQNLLKNQLGVLGKTGSREVIKLESMTPIEKLLKKEFQIVSGLILCFNL